MAYLILGLVLFLGVHSVCIFAEDWRTQTRARMGEGAYKGVYSLLSLIGFWLIIWGFAAVPGDAETGTAGGLRFDHR